ncbi:hypothetical protein C900_02221 [Fulvivirga imtechensis AK7]|uniref:Uncharacterized protein n=1 Tax=Fulvivirga imtechensis AK7 TaxID=1237149 RepID=L8JSA7_9BACT|nr:hypothetical protein C900_02221 [Fulvivirga imtechensis AK7]
MRGYIFRSVVAHFLNHFTISMRKYKKLAGRCYRTISDFPKFIL